MSNSVTKMYENNSVTIFKAPEAAELNLRDFKVELGVGNEWVEAPVYRMKVAYGNRISGYNIFHSSSIMADIKGTVKVRVTSLCRNIKHCRIRPLSDNIKFNFDRTTVEFTVDKPLQLSLEINGDIYRNLHLFFNAPEENIPDKDDPNVIYIPAGIHTIGNCEYIEQSPNMEPVLYVTDGKTLYLEGGSIVKAHIHVMGDNVTICGRGIVDLIHTNSPTCIADKLPDRNIYPRGIKLDHCNNVTVRDIMVKNPCHYIVSGNQCTNVTLDNLKLFACHSWSDGIDMMSSSHIRIKNCFVRSNDDSIAIYARRWDCVGDPHDWVVENCVLWADSAHSINIGTHGSQDPNVRETIYDMHFKDIDILEINCSAPIYYGAMAFSVGDEVSCRDFTFENIRVDDFSSSCLFFLVLLQNGSFNPCPGYKIENISFKDIYYNGANINPSQIAGFDDERKVKNVSFENVVINGKRITSFEEGNIEVGKYTENITIK